MWTKLLISILFYILRCYCYGISRLPLSAVPNYFLEDLGLVFTSLYNPSPINIDTNHLKVLTVRSSFHFSGALEVLILPKHAKPYISGGPLRNTLGLERVIFHWGEKGNAIGSDHSINGQHFPVELHAVYKRPYLPGIFPKNLDTVIIAYFFEISKDENFELSQLIANNFTTFTLDKLIPEQEEYAIYRGSLTVSPYTGGVIWLISLKPLKVKKEQLEAFQNKTYVKSIRRTQPLYGRQVYRFNAGGGK